MRITSAPICARVMPPSGAATKAAASTTRMPDRMAGAVMPLPPRGRAGTDAGQLGAREREVRQRLAEHLAVLAIADGSPQRGAHDPAGARGGLHAAAHHARHREVEALAQARLAADHVRVGDEEVLE